MSQKTQAVAVIAAAVMFMSSAGFAAQLRQAKGQVEIQRASAGPWAPATSSTKISDGDRLRTGAGAAAEMKLDAGHRVSLREKTTVQVVATKNGSTTLSLVVGRIRAVVNKLKYSRKFEVKTPLAVASVRGTVFEVEVLEDQSSRLSVLEGVVGYRDLAGLGKEVSVLKGQSVVVEPNAAPRPPEQLPRDLRQGLVPDNVQRTAEFMAKQEVQREAAQASFKDYFQQDAAQEMKVAQYQEGKTMVDAFGHRVRVEEFIVRPAPNQFSFVSLNTRQHRFDFTRFDLYAANPLPADLNTIDLFAGGAHDSMSNWAVKTHRLSSNGGDYYREWQDGGHPVNMTVNDSQAPNNGAQFQLVVFNDWFVEVKDLGSAPTLLSHWVPDAAFSGGNPRATFSRDDLAAKANGFPNLPGGYKNYDANATGGIGDAAGRAIDTAGFTNLSRLDYFGNTPVADAYKASEGYDRTSVALFDDKPFIPANSATAADTLFFLNATKVSRRSTYDVPGSAEDITLQVDQYTILDDGRRLNFLQAATLGSNVQGVNFEHVFTSSLLGKRKIDVVVSPSIFKKAGLTD